MSRPAHLSFEVNCYGTLNMLELALRKGVKRFVYASSANVYGAPKQNPVTEETPFDPRVPYDYSKVAGESFVWGYRKAKGLPVSVTRSWLLFGENDTLSRAVPRFLKSCIDNQPIKLFNSGRDVTAPCHATNYGKLVTTLGDDSEFAEVDNVTQPLSSSAAKGAMTMAPPPIAIQPGMSFQDAKQAAVDAFEKEYLLKLFIDSDYNLSEASRRSGVDRSAQDVTTFRSMCRIVIRITGPAANRLPATYFCACKVKNSIKK